MCFHYSGGILAVTRAKLCTRFHPTHSGSMLPLPLFFSRLPTSQPPTTPRILPGSANEWASTVFLPRYSALWVWGIPPHTLSHTAQHQSDSRPQWFRIAAFLFATACNMGLFMLATLQTWGLPGDAMHASRQWGLHPGAYTCINLDLLVSVDLWRLCCSVSKMCFHVPCTLKKEKPLMALGLDVWFLEKMVYNCSLAWRIF